MRCFILVVSIMITSCVHNIKPTTTDSVNIRSDEYQQEIDLLLSIDADNKKWEEIYLREIAIAQDNDDRDAYKFFIVEYIKIPRIPLPEWMKSEPGYVERKTATQVLRGQFMNDAGIRIIITPN